MKHSYAIALGAVVLAAGSVGVATSQSNAPMMTPGSDSAAAMLSDPMFVRAVQRSNDAEIADARYLLRYSRNATVRDFATQMVSDHSSSNVSLQTAARNAHVPPPGRVRAAAPSAAIQGMTGTQLDMAYMQQQVTAHRATLAILMSEASSGKNPELRAFANMQVPIVQSHLDKAQNYLSAQPSRPNVGSSVAPISPGGVSGGSNGGNGSLLPPPSPAPAGSTTPGPEPSVGIPGSPSPRP